MGFTKLLPTSRAFRRIVDRPSRYTLAQQNLLPKFGPPKQAQAKPAGGADAAKHPAQEIEREAPKNAPAAVPARIGILKKMINVLKIRNRIMNPTTSIPRVASESVAAKPEQAFPLCRWTLFKNPFKRGMKPKPPPDTGAVQTELLLELVKPVRNDLSDSDIEVICIAKPAPAPQPRAVAVLASRDPAAGETGVSRMSKQFFGAGKP
jgi:hypothetical protein